MAIKYITSSKQGLSIMTEEHASLMKAIAHAQNLLVQEKSKLIEISKEIDGEKDREFVSFMMSESI